MSQCITSQKYVVHSIASTSIRCRRSTLNVWHSLLSKRTGRPSELHAEERGHCQRWMLIPTDALVAIVSVSIMRRGDCCPQALRQTLLKKYARIRTEMDNLHNKRMSPYEKIEALESIRCQIQGSWRTDEIRRQKPTPQVCLSKQEAACMQAQPSTAIDYIRPDLSATV